MNFPKDCRKRCPHYKIYDTGTSISVYCELLDEECDVMFIHDYELPCPKPFKNRRKEYGQD